MALAQELVARAQTLVVNTAPTRQDAANLWDLLRTARKQAETQKEEVCRPLKTAWDEAKKPFDAFVKDCQAAEVKLQTAMSTYDREQARIAAEEQAKLQAKIDAQNAKIIQKAEAKGIEPVLKVAPVVQEPPKSIETQAGTSQTRTEKTVYGIKGIETDGRVYANNPALKDLAAQFPILFQFDWVAFRKLASTGILDSVPGVTKSIEYVYSQRAK